MASQPFESLFNNPSLSDVVIEPSFSYSAMLYDVSGKVRYHAHKAILSNSSAVFREMFQPGGRKYSNAHEVPVSLPSVHPEAFELMLRFFYTRKVDFLSMSQVDFLTKSVRVYHDDDYHPEMTEAEYPDKDIFDFLHSIYYLADKYEAKDFRREATQETSNLLARAFKGSSNTGKMVLVGIHDSLCRQCSNCDIQSCLAKHLWEEEADLLQSIEFIRFLKTHPTTGNTMLLWSLEQKEGSGK